VSSARRSHHSVHTAALFPRALNAALATFSHHQPRAFLAPKLNNAPAVLMAILAFSVTVDFTWPHPPLAWLVPILHNVFRAVRRLICVLRVT
jgi:hypothetical protein